MRKISLLAFLLLLHDASSANNAFYVTLGSQLAKQKTLDVIANNVANTDTTGYEADSMIYNSYNFKNKKVKNIDFVVDQATLRIADEGQLLRTERNLDVAIVGEGYLQVLTPEGPKYTRDGKLLFNNDGVLINQSGYPVASSDGDLIMVENDHDKVIINNKGMITIGEEEIQAIGVFNFNNKNGLIKVGQNLLTSDETPIAQEEVHIISGSLRGSNVRAMDEMVNMVEIQRSVGMSASLIKDLDQLERDSMNKINKFN